MELLNRLGIHCANFGRAEHQDFHEVSYLVAGRVFG
jgi:hypothetical protein